MLTTDTECAGTSNLDELESFVDQQEANLGPLVNTGNAGPNSVFTFDMDSPPPAQFVILRLTPGGAAPVIAGFTRICQGNCLVGGQLAGVAAYRSAAAKAAVPAVKPASALEQAVNGELPSALGFKDLIVKAAAAMNLPISVVAAIGSVESAWGTSSLMQPNGPAGTGDRKPRPPDPPQRPKSMPPDGLGFGRGLMQIDWDFHDFARTGNWRDAKANIEFSCGLLAADRDRFIDEMGLSADDALKAAVASYNAGFSGALSAIRNQGLVLTVAPGTYAGNALARAEFFRANGFA